MVKITLALSLLIAQLAQSQIVHRRPVAAPRAVQPARAAQTTTYSCTAPVVFRGADDGGQSFAVFSVCAVGNAPDAGGFYTAEAVYELKNAFTVDRISTWFGTAQGSIEEASGELTIEVPTAVAGQYQTKWIIANQKDKHADVEGERIEHFVPRNPTTLPVGSRLHFYFNLGIIKTLTNCPLGCGQQLNVYLNGV